MYMCSFVQTVCSVLSHWILFCIINVHNFILCKFVSHCHNVSLWISCLDRDIVADMNLQRTMT